MASVQRTASAQAVADLVRKSDVLLVATGAGDGASSGLKVYKEVSETAAYREAGLTYEDICTTHWLRDDPELFYGFWGSCLNAYRDTRPHDGNAILRRWRDERFGEDAAFASSWACHAGERSEVGGARFLYLTSNVDRHAIASGLARSARELCEIHGHVEAWQCSQPSACSGGPSATWAVPRGFRFEVDEATMRARAGPPRHAAQGTPSETAGWDENWPRCPHCSGLARPAVLMFGDREWIDPTGESLFPLGAS
eukprot:m51a1_g13331 hypothetical protein (254) ;mRNA; r:1402-2163